MKDFILIIGFTVLALAAAGWLGLRGGEAHSQATVERDTRTLLKYLDPANNVVCYRVRGFEGVSCLVPMGPVR